MESLTDKLRALGVKKGIGNLIAPPAKKKKSIHEIISGDYLDTRYGKVFVHTDKFPANYLQGNMLLSTVIQSRYISKWAKTPLLDDKSSRELIFLDTETTSLSSGTGTFVFLTGIGNQSQDGFEVRQFFLESPVDEPALLEAIIQDVSRYTGVVTFNGKAFDIPMLNTRFALNNSISPFKAISHIDLLPLARRLWKYRLSRRNLSTLENEIIGVKRTEEEIPGWMIPEMYIDFLRSQDPTPLRGVFYHNSYDILSLAALYFHLSDLMENLSISKMDESLDLMALGKLFKDLNDYEKAIMLFENSILKGLPQEFYLSTLNEYAQIHKKDGRIDSAVSLWKKAEAYHDIFAAEELAKYYEHQKKDLESAKEIVKRTLENINLTNFSGSKKRIWTTKFKARLERLEEKIRLTQRKKTAAHT